MARTTHWHPPGARDPGPACSPYLRRPFHAALGRTESGQDRAAYNLNGESEVRRVTIPCWRFRPPWITKVPPPEFDRSSLVFAAIAAAGRDARFNAVQLVNLVFLADTEYASDLGGPHFAFEPRPYGPYDAAVLDCVEHLAGEGRVCFDNAGAYWACSATVDGLPEGRAESKRMPRPASRFVQQAAPWVLSLRLGALRCHPDMAANNQIPQEALRGTEDPPEGSTHPFLRGMAQSIGVLRRPGGDEPASSNPTERDWLSVGDDLRRAMERVLPSVEIS